MSRRLPMVVALLLVCILGVAIHCARPGEPSYHGKSLSQWLDQLDDHQARGGVTWRPLPAKTTQQIQAADAIQAIGTNAIPRLLHDLSVSDSPYFELLQRAQQYFGEKILHRTTNPSLEPATPAVTTRWKAALAMDALGPAARSAIPQLASIVKKTTSPPPCKEASFILAGMGSAGIAVLTNRTPSRNSWQHLCATWAIAQHPQSSTNLVPWLLDLLTNPPPGPGPSYPGEIWALGEIHADAPHVIPVLIEELNNTNGGFPCFRQSAAAEALGNYGKDASNAISALRSMTNDPQLQWVAQEALQKIISDTSS